LFAAFAIAPFARAAAQGAAPDSSTIVVARNVKIGMRTGGPLLARIFRPVGAALRPAIFSLETDTTAAREENARALAAAGYAVVIATPRGGDDRHVGRDGSDAIEWINDQPWSDRRIVMAGTGEGANAAWNAAREHPAHLSAILARASARPLGWSDTEVRRVVISVLSIAGSAGDAQGYAVENHALYVRTPHAGAAPTAYLVIGTLKQPDLDLLERQWFDWAVGRAPMPPLLRKRVNYLVVNDGIWIGADSLPSIGARPTSYPLHSNAGPRAALGGFLGEAPREDEPADTVSGEKNYETLLAAPLNLAGRPAVTLWLKHEVSNPAREVFLAEILADGTVVPLGMSSGALHAADSTAAPGSPDRWDFGSFPWIAWRLASGGKLRLTVNGPPTVIYHDIERYSRVILPAVKTP
jgi:predicted acyl esterase